MEQEKTGASGGNERAMLNGTLIFDKPEGYTSHDVVARLRGFARQRRIGHGGTLDPIATGVLPIFFGTATKAAEYAAAQEKEYLAEIRLGLTTDTQDITGTVLRQALPASRAALEEILPAFRGEIDQKPPMYSAVMKNGQRLYKLARQGVEIERESRRVTISALELSEEREGDYLLRIVCSKGTYIRTLCHDIGETLGCGGTMTGLRRIRAGNFLIEGAVGFPEVERACTEGRFDSLIRPVDRLFSHLPALTLSERGTAQAANGAWISPKELRAGTLPEEGGLCRVYGSDGVFLMLGKTGFSVKNRQGLLPEKMFVVK